MARSDLTAADKAALAADARNRMTRTLQQGAAAVLIVALAAAWPVIADALHGNDVASVDWSAVAVSAATAALLAAGAYVQRTWLDPSRLPSNKPPGD